METIPCHQVDSTMFQNQNQVAIQMNQLKEIMTERRFWPLRKHWPHLLEGTKYPFQVQSTTKMWNPYKLLIDSDSASVSF